MKLTKFFANYSNKVLKFILGCDCDGIVCYGNADMFVYTVAQQKTENGLLGLGLGQGKNGYYALISEILIFSVKTCDGIVCYGNADMHKIFGCLKLNIECSMSYVYYRGVKNVEISK